MGINLKRKNPVIYEINTWVWLKDLGERYERTVTLKDIPIEVLESFVDKGVDVVWFMGVWERSPAGIEIAIEHKGLESDYRGALSHYSKDDVVGSPYSIKQYMVDECLGGREGLKKAREVLADYGIGMILDYVPNHIAQDNPMVFDHPEYLVQGGLEDLARKPGAFFEAGEKVIAFGKDPYFPPWTDTAQLNAFSDGLRGKCVDILKDIASQCDGVRCDMAMLMINSVFKKTWGDRVGAPLAREFWLDIIESVRGENPQFMFVAEAYWGMEWELQQMGFDYCYDKRLYDRLVEGNSQGLQLHLQANNDFQKKLIRFIENHDEPRALPTFGAERIRAAAVTALTLPGARLVHEGQMSGYKKKLPVQLGRRDREETDTELNIFYRELLKTVKTPVFNEGDWSLCKKSGWESNVDYMNLVSWCWKKGEAKWVIVVNLSNQCSKGKIFIPWPGLVDKKWILTDRFTGEEYVRDGKELIDQGLFVKLKSWGFHFLEVSPLSGE